MKAHLHLKSCIILSSVLQGPVLFVSVLRLKYIISKENKGHFSPNVTTVAVIIVYDRLEVSWISERKTGPLHVNIEEFQLHAFKFQT